MDALYTQEAIGHGTTRVARSGYEDIHLFLSLLTDEVTEQTGHETGTHILECQRGAMEQFE